METITSQQAERLDYLIDKYNDILIERGMELAESDQVLLLDEDSDEFTFEVQGSRKRSYIVRVRLEHQEDKRKKPSFANDTYCECPYFEDRDVCKHVAAALLVLSEFEVQNPQIDLWNNQFNKTKELIASKKNRDPEYPGTFQVSDEDWDRILDILPNPSLPKGYVLSKIQLVEDGIFYTAFIQGYPIEIKVSYIHQNQRLEIDFPKSARRFVPYIFQYIRGRFSEPYYDQDFITQKIRLESKRKFLEQNNLLDKVKDPEKAVDLVLYGDRIGYKYSGELAGLRNLEELQAKIAELLPKAKEDQFIQNLKESDRSKEAGKYNVGIIIAFSSHQGSFEFHPIIGKGKKNNPKGLETKIEILTDSLDYRIAEYKGVAEMTQALRSFYWSQVKKSPEETWKAGVRFFILAKQFPCFNLGYNLHPTKVSAKDLINRVEIYGAHAKMKLIESGYFYELQLVLTYNGPEEVYQWKPGQAVFHNGFLLRDNLVLYLENFRHAEGVNSLQQILPFKFPKERIREIVTEVIRPLSAFLPYEDELNFLAWTTQEGQITEELYITELGGLVAFVPKMIYGDQLRVNPLDPSLIVHPETGDFLERNQEAEQQFLLFIKELHPDFEKNAPKFLFSLTAAQFAEGVWFLEAFEKLKERGVKTYGLENIKVKRYSPFPARVNTQFSSSPDWFGVHSDVSFGDEIIPLSRLKRTWESGEKFIQLGDGSLGKIPEEWMQKMVRILRSGELAGEEIRLSKVHFMLLEDWEDTAEFAKIQAEVNQKKQKMQQFEGIQDVALPNKLQAELRPYQKTGLNWLNFLRDFNWGGILADDMGLGKTLQMITLICQLEEQNPSVKILIVAPTTLLFNWKKEVEKFSPHLDYFIHHGQRYENAEELNRHQLVMTSYGLVINDLELLRQIEWDLIIADESQAIKNTSSLRYKAMVRLHGKQKIALTGTPIENGIQELYAQMNFTNPGFFKTFNHFTENFLSQIKKGDPDISQTLRKQITPFVLRRTKKEVLSELPDKIEEFLYCEMGAVQRAIYEARRQEYRDSLMKKFDESGADQSKMFVLEGLTRLRQICDSPKLTGDTEAIASAKIDLLKEHILEKTGNHKILVFSQFVKMLDLIRDQLQQHQIPFSYLDGQTSLSERERQVQRFQENKSVRVFLISLKAGGTGLNLTAADYVYIVDPWWNPAVENQAIDRCYRMGQEKHVVAYRMICQNTIEEKIMELQSAKSQLAKDIIGEGEGILAGLDREGMLELFS